MKGEFTHAIQAHRRGLHNGLLNLSWLRDKSQAILFQFNGIGSVISTERVKAQHHNTTKLKRYIFSRIFLLLVYQLIYRIE